MLKLSESLIYNDNNSNANPVFRYSSFFGKIVPNPGLSSLALWSSQSHQKVGSMSHSAFEQDVMCIGMYLVMPHQAVMYKRHS